MERFINYIRHFIFRFFNVKFRSECDELRTFQSKYKIFISSIIFSIEIIIIFNRFLQSGMRHEHMKQIEEKIHKEQIKLVIITYITKKFIRFS